MSLPVRVHQATLGLDRATYRAENPSFVAVTSVVTMVAFVALVIGVWKGTSRRHWGDLLAGTVVIRGG